MTSLKTCLNARFSFVCYLLLFSATNVFAGSVNKSYVDYDGNEYHLNLIMSINAPSNKVWQLLTDYKNLQKVNPVIQQSQVLKRAKATRVKVISKGCIWFFCRTITQVQDIRDLGRGFLVISEVEGKSDFASGYTMWHVIPQQHGTRVTIRAKLKPDFWIPPFIGPWLFQDALVQQGETVINNLEKLARP